MANTKHNHVDFAAGPFHYVVNIGDSGHGRIGWSDGHRWSSITICPQAIGPLATALVAALQNMDASKPEEPAK